jgi:hypothetical protein
MDQARCFDCGTELDLSDNYCRQCGTPARAARLPSVRTPQLPAMWRPVVSPAVKGAAVMAAGTVGQFLLRRAVRSVLGGATNRASGRTLAIRRPRRDDGMIDDAQIITETVMMRRVRVRRRP